MPSAPGGVTVRNLSGTDGTAMMNITKVLFVAAASAAVCGGFVLSPAAHARECTRLAFSVNDYGIEGPKRDAQRLLDEYIEKWTAERGIKKYTVGKKDVSCKLFLDFIVFDEHTCRAEAPVCW